MVINFVISQYPAATATHRNAFLTQFMALIAINLKTFRLPDADGIGVHKQIEFGQSETLATINK
ncbi:hypothetical protein D3C72_1765370 [compost metagenome]